MSFVTIQRSSQTTLREGDSKKFVQEISGRSREVKDVGRGREEMRGTTEKRSTKKYILNKEQRVPVKDVSALSEKLCLILRFYK